MSLPAESKKKVQLLVVGLTTMTRPRSLEDLLSANCSHRILEIDLREDFALVELESASDLTRCAGRYTLQGQQIVALVPSEALEREIAMTGRVPAGVTQQLLSAVPAPGAPDSSVAGAPPPSLRPPEHQRCFSDSQLLVFGSKRLREGGDLAAEYANAERRLFADSLQQAGRGGVHMPPMSVSCSPFSPQQPPPPPSQQHTPRCGGMHAGPAIPMQRMASYQQGVGLLAMEGGMQHARPNYTQGMCAPSVEQQVAMQQDLHHQHEAQRLQNLQQAALWARQHGHVRALSDNAVMQVYTPSPFLAPILAAGDAHGMLCGGMDAELRARLSLRRTRLGLSYKCGRCGKPKKGHLCKAAAKGAASANSDGANGEQEGRSSGGGGDDDEADTKLESGGDDPKEDGAGAMHEGAAREGASAPKADADAAAPIKAEPDAARAPTKGAAGKGGPAPKPTQAQQAQMVQQQQMQQMQQMQPPFGADGSSVLQQAQARQPPWMQPMLGPNGLVAAQPGYPVVRPLPHSLQPGHALQPGLAVVPVPALGMGGMGAQQVSTLHAQQALYYQRTLMQQQQAQQQQEQQERYIMMQQQQQMMQQQQHYRYVNAVGGDCGNAASHQYAHAHSQQQQQRMKLLQQAQHLPNMQPLPDGALGLLQQQQPPHESAEKQRHVLQQQQQHGDRQETQAAHKCKAAPDSSELSSACRLAGCTDGVSSTVWQAPVCPDSLADSLPTSQQPSSCADLLMHPLLAGQHADDELPPIGVYQPFCSALDPEDVDGTDIHDVMHSLELGNLGDVDQMLNNLECIPTSEDVGRIW